MEQIMADPTTLIRLIDAVEPSQVGGKAASLGDLARAGYTVPDGVVIPVGASRRRSSEVLASQAIEILGERPFAVRSSAVGEDATGSSHAGQYETVLDVMGAESLATAIEACLASAGSDRVVEYRRRQGLEGSAPMAVIVQRMVDADAAGVAFTANPVTGDRDEVLVSAVRGVGARLVSGEADPDEWVVRADGRPDCVHDREGSITAEQAAAIAEVARRIETGAGAPRDIEWAVSGGIVHVLQSRPITGLAPESVEWEPPGDGYWWRDDAHFNRPITPLTASVYAPRLRAAINASIERYGFVPERIDMERVGHRMYASVVPPGGRHGAPPPKPVLWLLSRLLPPMRRKRRLAAEAFASDLPARDVEWWWSEGRAETFARLRALEAFDRAGCGDAELVAHAHDVADFYTHGQDAHFRLFTSHVLGVAELVAFCRDVLGWDDGATCALMSGHSPMSSEPGRLLAELTRLAAAKPAVREALSGDDPTQALDADAEFAAAFAGYVDEFGVRAMSYDAADPVFAEDPAVLLRTIHGQLESGYDPEAVDARLRDEREAAVERARASLADRPDERERFEDLRRRNEAAFGVREDNEFPTVSAAIGLLRMVALELGRRLAARGQLGEPDDVFMVDLDDALRALEQGDDLHETVAKHRKEIEQSLASPPPRSFGEEHPPPDMSALPGALRRFNEAMVWFIANDVDAPPVEGDGLCGVGGSAGSYTGTVRIIRDETEFAKLEPGDVMVCPITSPVWSVLFSQVGALVTDHGGLLSHSAIIAREYGIPAVLATQVATAELQDGQRVRVDGAAGRVEAL